MKSTILTKELLTSFKSLLFEGKREVVHTWLITNINKENKKDMKFFFDYIMNEFNLFSYRDTNFNLNIVEQFTWRAKEILVIFPLKEQLKLIAQWLIDENFYVNYFDNITLYKSDDMNKKTFKNNMSLSIIGTKLLFQEKFEEIDKIEKKLGVSILKCKANIVQFNYKKEHVRGNHNIKITKDLFSPVFDIILNYNLQKRQYLESKKIKMPTLEEVNNFKEEIERVILNTNVIGKMNNSPLDLIRERIKKYQTIMFFNNLNNKLEMKQTEIKKMKI